MEKLNILYQTSDYYACYAGVSIFSLLENNKDIEEIEIYILSDDISTENLEKISDMIEKYGRKLTRLDTKPVYEFLSEAGVPKFRGSYSTYYKLFVMDQLPKDVERILYIDSDTIINGSLREVLEFDFKGKPMAMTACITQKKLKEKIGLGENEIGYNAGVMLISIPLWKENDCTQRIINRKDNMNDFYFAADNTLLVLEFNKDIMPMELKYNFNTIYSLFKHKELIKLFNTLEANIFNDQMIKYAEENLLIYHYVPLQVGRPWEKNNIHPKKNLWNKYKNESPWKNVGHENVHRGIIFGIQRKMYKWLPRSVYILLYRIAWRIL